MSALALVAALTLAASPEAAEPSPEAKLDALLHPPELPAPRNAVSLAVTSLFVGTWSVQYERLVHPRVSALGGVAFRTLAGGDYRSLHLAGSVEGRVWILEKSPWTPLAACRAGGPYTGLRADLSHTRLTAPSGTALSSWGVAGTVLVGYRLPIACRVEVTPHAGIGAHADFGGPAPWVRGVVSAGATVGVLF